MMDYEAVFVPALEIMHDDADRSPLVRMNWKVLSVGNGSCLERRFLDDTSVVDVLMPGAHPEPANTIVDI